jgi:hypothetical protein
MTSKLSPWEGVPTPAKDYNVVRVPDTRGVTIYWGRDTTSQCLLIVQLGGDHTDQFRRDTVTLNGIAVDLRQDEVPGQQRLVLTLARHVDTDLFQGLCNTLIDRLREITDSATALSVTLAHLKRWKAFLSGRNARLLSLEEQRGLFGELHTLRLLYASTLSKPGAVDAWCGPDDLHQDFIFGNRAIEVKTLSGRERSSIRISSEDQLEAVVDDLFLLTLRLSELPDSDRALSLNDLVAEVEKELAGEGALEVFSDKLAGMGYAHLREYDFPRLAVTKTQGYRVVEPFPRLIRSRLPEGIMKVAYDIKLEAIMRYECSDGEVFGRP